MTKEEILDYVTSTPENTNRRILSDMIDELVSSSGGGGGSTGLVINGVPEGTRVTLDKTWQEIYEAFSAGQPCVILWGDQSTYESAIAIVSVFKYGSEDFRVCYASPSGGNELLYCTSADGYPAASFD